MTDPANPYIAPKVDGPETPSLKRQSFLHVGLFLSMFALWVATIVLVFTPNNKLNAYGLGNAIALDLFVGVPFAFVIAIVSLVKRQSCPNLPLLIVTQLLAWGHSVGLIALLVLAGIFAIRNGA